jgi:multiple sugar transport system substrate-binding protein
MKRTVATVAAIGALVLAGCGGSSNSSGGSGSGTASGPPTGHQTITFWEGYTGQEAKAIKVLAKEFNSTHSHTTVEVVNSGNSDYALQKVLAAIAGGKPPDISYLYGSWAPNIATNPKVVALNSLIESDPSFNWKDFWPSERAVATVNGKIIGVPALVDNLALVYNKKLFAQAGLAPPTPQWTWSDFEHAAATLTDPAKKQFGWAYVNDGSEDTVWRYWAMLWQAGGAILNSAGNQAAFDSPAGLKALQLLQRLTAKHAIYLDNGSDNYRNVFGAGHIGMLWTGPWDLAEIINEGAPYGVQVLPGEANHQTISGPDNWVMFDNGEQHKKASWEFLKWFTSPTVDLQWATLTGDLPIRQSITKLPGYQRYLAKYPGIGTWVSNLANATQARPSITSYPRISTVIGQMVQSVLLGQSQPQQALDSAAKQVNAILTVPGA